MASTKQKSIFHSTAGEWTITTHLGELLLEAEKNYGDRVLDWTPIGVEIRDGSRSAVMPLGDTNKRYIVLNSCVECDMDEAVFSVVARSHSSFRTGRKSQLPRGRIGHLFQPQ